MELCRVEAAVRAAATGLLGPFGNPGDDCLRRPWEYRDFPLALSGCSLPAGSSLRATAAALTEPEVRRDIANLGSQKAILRDPPCPPPGIPH